MRTMPPSSTRAEFTNSRVRRRVPGGGGAAAVGQPEEARSARARLLLIGGLRTRASERDVHTSSRKYRFRNALARSARLIHIQLISRARAGWILLLSRARALALDDREAG